MDVTGISLHARCQLNSITKSQKRHQLYIMQHDVANSRTICK